MALKDSLLKAIDAGAKVNRLGIERDSDLRLREVKERQRSELYSGASMLFGIGSSLAGNISSNREIMDFAKGEGFEVSSSKFANIFGSPKFSKDGQTYGAQDIESLRQFDLINKQRNLLDLLRK